ncbi:MAG: hypothetical protein JXQ97_08515 [Natronospirillum sp.]
MQTLNVQQVEQVNGGAAPWRRVSSQVNNSHRNPSKSFNEARREVGTALAGAGAALTTSKNAKVRTVGIIATTAGAWISGG